MAKVYRVKLSQEERIRLESFVKKGKVSAKTRRAAQILLKADEGDFGPSWIDSQISEALDVSIPTIERYRERLVTQGLDAALTRVIPDRSHRKKIDGKTEAHLIALACSEPPAGRASWSLQLLTDRLIELNYFDSISKETVRQTLKKMKLSLG